MWPDKILPGERRRIRGNFFRRSGRNQISSRFARSRSEVNHVVSAANCFLVVFDHQHGIAQIAQGFQRVEQAPIVARMQTDRRLVQHVEHAAQSRANLRRQPNSLRFATGKRCRGTIERQVAKPDGEKKIDALGNFRKRPPSDFALPQIELRANLVDSGARARISGNAVNSASERSRDLDRETFRAQPASLASRANAPATCIA